MEIITFNDETYLKVKTRVNNEIFIKTNMIFAIESIGDDEIKILFPSGFVVIEGTFEEYRKEWQRYDEIIDKIRRMTKPPKGYMTEWEKK